MRIGKMLLYREENIYDGKCIYTVLSYYYLLLYYLFLCYYFLLAKVITVLYNFSLILTDSLKKI